MMKRLILAFLLIAVFSVPVHAFQNGSFEFGTVTGDFDTLSAGSTFISPWTIEAGDLDLIRDYWTAEDGFQSIDLNGTEAGTLEQLISTSVGCTYTVTFSLAGNSDNGPVMKTLDVYINDNLDINPIYSFGTTASAQDSEWADVDFSFEATSPSTLVSFRSTTVGAWGPAIDNVRLSEPSCPPPSSIPTLNEWGMMIFMALAGLIAVYYMRKQTTV
jgi:choice-of-anchor C domain-containing protein